MTCRQGNGVKSMPMRMGASRLTSARYWKEKDDESLVAFARGSLPNLRVRRLIPHARLWYSLVFTSDIFPTMRELHWRLSRRKSLRVRGSSLLLLTPRASRLNRGCTCTDGGIRRRSFQHRDPETEASRRGKKVVRWAPKICANLRCRRTRGGTKKKEEPA